MKIVSLFTFLMAGSCLFAQLPAPTNLSVDVCYRDMGSGPTCGPDVPELGYLLTYTWDAPNTEGVTATLTGYNIYHEGNFITTVESSPFISTSAFDGSVYVTAVYSNPSGESGASNTFTIDVPLSNKEAESQSGFVLYPNPADKVVSLSNFSLLKSLTVVNMQGQVMMRLTSFDSTVDISRLPAGIYNVEMVDKTDRVYKSSFIKK